MTDHSFLAALRRGPLVCDGAMGTQLQARGLEPGECGETWNVAQPAQVETIHRRYAEAGCDLITTNTFGGTPLALARHGLAARARELNEAGARIARRAAAAGKFVLGDVGPLGELLEPLGEITAKQAEVAFRDQAAALLSGGADAILVETMTDPEEAAIAIAAARAAGAPAVIGTFSFQKAKGEFRTMMGTSVKDCLARAVDAGADVVGSNCGTDLTLGDYVQLARELVAAASGRPVILQPNAGAPVLLGGKAVYQETPDQLAAIVPALLAAGVRIIGGCCGTTPEHLAAMARVVRQA